MPYDFETMLDRRGKDSIAANVVPFEGLEPDPGFEPIPMWVADMSFPVAPCVIEALHRRVDFPSFGYYAPGKAYTDAILAWHRARKGVEDLKPEYIGYENGVLGGLSSTIQALTSPGEAILLHAPTYTGFSHTVDDTGRVAVRSLLKRDEAGVWRMDYEDMDRKLREHRIHLVVFCSPHNPSGRVWERREIERAMEVYAANDCVVFSDEIWSDIIMPGHTHIPTQSVSEDAKRRTVALYSPSKSFSLAALTGSYHVIYNEALRHRIEKRASMSHYNACNVLSYHALLAAYGQGAPWLDELCRVIDENHALALDFFREHAPEVRIARPQGTYMLFLDCGDWCRAHGLTIRELLARGVRCGVIWQNGEDFYWPDSIRMNLALPRAKLAEALDRLRQYAFI